MGHRFDSKDTVSDPSGYPAEKVKKNNKRENRESRMPVPVCLKAWRTRQKKTDRDQIDNDERDSH